MAREWGGWEQRSEWRPPDPGEEQRSADPFEAENNNNNYNYYYYYYS